MEVKVIGLRDEKSRLFVVVSYGASLKPLLAGFRLILPVLIHLFWGASPIAFLPEVRSNRIAKLLYLFVVPKKVVICSVLVRVDCEDH
jgi:hypothetical protein